MAVNNELLPNDVLQELMHKSLNQIGGFDYTSKENEFAKSIAETLKVKIGGENLLKFIMKIKI